MERAIVFDLDDGVMVTYTDLPHRTLGRPKCMLRCKGIPDFENFGGVTLGDRFRLIAKDIGIDEAFVLLGVDESEFVFASVATWGSR